MRTSQFISVLLLAVIVDGFIVTGLLRLCCNQAKVAPKAVLRKEAETFSSYEEAKKAYNMLLKSEQKLSHKIKYFIDLCVGTSMLATHHKEVTSFYKRLFKLIAKKEYHVCASHLFPKIVMLKNDTKKISTRAQAIYQLKKNRILIRKKDVSITNCLTFLHEFAHYLQDIGITTTSGKNARQNQPNSIAREVDAELFSITHHPDPGHLLKQLEERMQHYTEGTEDAKKCFPYFTSPQKYAKALDFFKIKGNMKWEKLAIKAYKERERLEKNITKIWVQAYKDEGHPLSILKKYPTYCWLRVIGTL